MAKSIQTTGNDVKTTPKETDLLAQVRRWWVDGRRSTPLEWLSNPDRRTARALQRKGLVDIAGGAIFPTGDKPGGVINVSVHIGHDRCLESLDFITSSESARLQCHLEAQDHSLDAYMDNPPPAHAHQAWTPHGHLVSWRSPTSAQDNAEIEAT